MTKDQVEAVLGRVPSWPQEQQRELADLALQIEAELAGGVYYATEGELRAIDEAEQSGLATDEEVATFWKRHGVA